MVRLLQEGIIEPSSSPWRAQVVIVHQKDKDRMVIDYSQTINRFTFLDAYPLPSIEDLVHKISGHRYFSSIDLRSAYHLVPLLQEDRPYTAFEANGKLFQFRRLPFGVTNGVSCFQRIMDNFISSHHLRSTYAYLDDVTICGETLEEHDQNLRSFMDAAEKSNLTLNPDKCSLRKDTICLLGYEIKHLEMRPDPERLRPLREMPLPSNARSLSRLTGLFAYYARWIPRFSEKLSKVTGSSPSFPLSPSARDAIESMKDDIVKAVTIRIDEREPFVVETDASDTAIGSTLSQRGRPVAFFSRTLSSSERRWCSYEKEAYAIVESVRKWRHYLAGKKFTLVTDQRSVSYMFDSKHRNKIKNDKIIRWRIELLPYTYDLVYRPGKYNTAADAMSRLCGAFSTSRSDLTVLHSSLCHPGVARLHHFVRMKNLPFSLSDVRQVISDCATCRRLKPQYIRPPEGTLVQAMKPFDRLSIDFKGPLPSSSHNRYLLIMVDEYSRFPFAYPCQDLSADTVIKCLTSVFTLFGTPSYVHSDRGTSFMSSAVKSFLLRHGVSSSRSTPYHPIGNAQCERYVGIVWRTVLLALDSRSLSSRDWEIVLPDALHSIRSLLCTSTNMTPHDRLFSYPRRSSVGLALPSWVLHDDVALLRRHNRRTGDPLVEEVKLLDVNPYYAHVEFPTGRVDTVSVSDLAPSPGHGPGPSPSTPPPSMVTPTTEASEVDGREQAATDAEAGLSSDSRVSELMQSPVGEPGQPAPVRRSERARKPPERLMYHSFS